MPFMFQLLGVGLVRIAKNAIWKGRRKNKKSAVDHIQISDTLLHCVSICFFGNKALGGCWTLGNYTLYI